MHTRRNRLRNLMRSAGWIAPLLLAALGARAQSQSPIPYGAGDVTWLGSVEVFAAFDAQHGVELWRSDDVGGAYLLGDIFPGSNGSFPRNLVNLNGWAFFSANDGADGVELWSSDGTAAGTHLVADIAPGPAGSNPENLTVANGLVFFAANDGVSGVELWCSDGSATGTRLVSDINPGPGNSSPRQLSALNGYVYFFATDSSGTTGFWRSDGTAAGTALVSSLGGSTPLTLTGVGNELVILAHDPAVGYQYWISDGSTVGTVPGPMSSTAAVTVTWAPVTQSTTGTALANLSGYRIYFGSSPAALTSMIDVADPTATSHVVANVPPGTTYFAMSAYVTGGLESDLSGIVAASVNLAP